MARVDASDRQSRELETRLAMLEAEARVLRSEVAEMSAAEARRAVRIGESRRTAPRTASVDRDEDSGFSESEAEAPRERVVLRLVGEPSAPPPSSAPVFTSAVARAPLPEVPVVSERLSVTGASRADVPPITAAPGVIAAPSAPAADPAADYRAALAFVTAQEFSRAHEALSRFLERYPAHTYADNALFWRAEIWFLQGEYARAVRDYDSLVSRFPAGNKAPDALLRIAVCHARLGNRGEAQAALERVRREYPSSDAARRASERDAT